MKKPSRWYLFVQNVLPVLIGTSIIAALVSLVVTACHVDSVDADNAYTRKRNFVNMCIVGKGEPVRVEGVLVCRGGKEDGASL